MTHQASLIPFKDPTSLVGLAAKLPAMFLPNEKTADRFFDFFTAHIRNRNTPRAYYKRPADFPAGARIGAARPGSGQTDACRRLCRIAGTAGTARAGSFQAHVKQHLAALRMLFDWLVVGHVLDVNPAHAVRGPKYSQKKGHQSRLAHWSARSGAHRRDDLHLRPCRAVLQMNVGDYFSQGRRGWVRLHEKGGKDHEAPCVPKLEAYLDEYIAMAGIGDDKDGALFRTTGCSTGTPHRLIQRRAKRVGIKTRIGNHSMRATGITDYLKKRRLAVRGAEDGKPRRHAYNAALRPARRRRRAR